MFQIWFAVLTVAGIWFTRLEGWKRWPPGR